MKNGSKPHLKKDTSDQNHKFAVSLAPETEYPERYVENGSM